MPMTKVSIKEPNKKEAAIKQPALNDGKLVETTTEELYKEKPGKAGTHRENKKKETDTEETDTEETDIEDTFKEETDSKILEEMKANFQMEEQRRFDELIRYLQFEFANSQELEDYVKKKNETLKEDKCCGGSIFEEENGPNIKIHSANEVEQENKMYPLTKLSRKKWILPILADKLKRHLLIKKIIDGQDMGILSIRKKIADQYKTFMCHKEERDKLKEEIREKLLLSLKQFDIDPAVFTTKSKVFKKITTMMKVRHSWRSENARRRMDIIKKLMREEERQNEINRQLNKNYNYRVRRKEKIIEDMEVIGKAITLLPPIVKSEESKLSLKKEEETVEEIENEPAGKLEDEKDKGQKNETKKKTEKKPKKKKANINIDQQATKGKKKKAKKASKNIRNKRSKTKSKTSKNKSKKPKEEEDLQVPLIPITNPRHFIKPDDPQKFSSMFPDIHNLCSTLKEENWLKAQYLKHLHLCPEDPYPFPVDHQIISIPDVLKFQGFKNGQAYKKTFKILNGGTTTKWFKLFKVFHEDEFNEDPNMFQLDLLGYQKLHPGLSQKLTLKFFPLDQKDCILGRLLFLTKTSGSSQPSKFCVPFRCNPTSVQVEVTPENIYFKKIPFWKLKEGRLANEERGKNNCQTLTIHNFGRDPIRLFICKQRNPLRVEGFEIEGGNTLEETEDILEETKDGQKEKEEGQEENVDGRGKTKNMQDKPTDGKVDPAVDQVVINLFETEMNQHLLRYYREDHDVKDHNAENRNVEDRDVENLGAKDREEREYDDRYLENLARMYKTEVEECFQNVFNTFSFETSFFRLEPNQKKKINVCFKNAPYVGYHMERYTINMYKDMPDGEVNIFGKKEITIEGETTGRFLIVNPLVLDFNICVVDSVYHAQFDVHNTDHLTHTISVRWPSVLGDYLRCVSHSTFVQPRDKITFSLKFIPRVGIMKTPVSFLDPETSILSFPLQMFVMTKGYTDVPPMKIKTFAVLTPSNGLLLRPLVVNHVCPESSTEHVSSIEYMHDNVHSNDRVESNKKSLNRQVSLNDPICSNGQSSSNELSYFSSQRSLESQGSLNSQRSSNGEKSSNDEVSITNVPTKGIQPPNDLVSINGYATSNNQIPSVGHVSLNNHVITTGETRSNKSKDFELLVDHASCRKDLRLIYHLSAQDHKLSNDHNYKPQNSHKLQNNRRTQTEHIPENDPLPSTNKINYKLSLTNKIFSYDSTYMIDMGECSTSEMIYVDLEIFNSSYAIQHYGILDLPDWLTVLPNFGFGEIFPLESKTLRIIFSPKKEDIRDYSIEGEDANHVLRFPISVKTIKSLGGSKKVARLEKSCLKKVNRWKRRDKVKIDDRKIDVHEIEDLSENTRLQQDFLRKIRRIKEEREDSTENLIFAESAKDSTEDILRRKKVFEEQASEQLLKTTDYTLEYFKESSKCLQEPSKHLQESSKDLQESSKDLQESSNDHQTSQYLKDLKNSSLDEKESKRFHGQIEIDSLEEDERSSDDTKGPNDDLTTIDAIPSKKIWIQGTVIDSLCDVSYQYVEFPDTPCGSYSHLTITLKGLDHFCKPNCVCGYINNVTKVQDQIYYVVAFEIFGDNPQITIQPSRGYVEGGGECKLFLLAKPEVQKETIVERARALKRQEIIDQRIKEILKKREDALVEKLKKARKKESKVQKGLKKKKGDGKKTHEKKSRGKVSHEKKSPKKMSQGKKSQNKINQGKKSRKRKVHENKVGQGKKMKERKGQGDERTTSEEEIDRENEREPLPEIFIKEEEIVLSHLDYYPAEMSLWRCIEPYTIKAKFTIQLNYISNDIKKKEDKIFIEAVCRVTRPAFVHNQKLQHISFGPTAIGDAREVTLEVQNILSDQKIFPELAAMSPLHPISRVCSAKICLEPEYIIRWPLHYRPLNEGQVQGFFEIVAGNTHCLMKFSGEGVVPDLSYNPDFVVCRLEAKFGGSAECSFEIKNKCKAPLFLQLVKICEIVGEMKSIPVDKSKQQIKDEPRTKREKKNEEGVKKVVKKCEKESDKGDKKSMKKGDKKSMKKSGKKGGKKGSYGKSSKKSKSSRGKKEKSKSLKFSNELTEDEIYSIKNFFESQEETSDHSSFFVILTENASNFQLEPFGRVLARIMFKEPEKTKEQDSIKRKKKGIKSSKKGSKSSKKGSGKKSKSSKDSKPKKKKGKSIGKKSNKSSRSKGSSRKGGSTKTGKKPDLYYVAKFNLTLGKITFLKDFIVIAKFVK